jgi:queuine tRNA-ribosyltransferase
MKSDFSFKILKKDSKSQARLGVLKTPHGTIKTPSYVIVGTHAQVKCLKPSDIKKTKTQVVISNTFHLWDKALKNRKDKHLVHTMLGSTIPVMTDSGGFQVFSFGAAKEHNVGKVLKQPVKKTAVKSEITITEKGVTFRYDEEKRFMSPEDSIAIQEKIGADIIFAFDECTSPLHPFTYNKTAMERTHRWAMRCLKARTRKDQWMYGIVQGGRFKQLRVRSAKAIAAMPFEGFGIGGSFGKNEMIATVKAIVPYLPEGKPRHLLGIGRIEDIFAAVENGMDTFDCVIPTREARHARLWTAKGAIDIRKAVFKNDKKRIDAGCTCQACDATTRAKLHALFKAKHPDAGRLATIHNVWFFNFLVERMRNAIARGRFLQFKKSYLKSLQT